MAATVPKASLILVLALAQLTLGQQYYENDDYIESDGRQPIVMIKPIQDMYVEEYETQVVKLQEYVSGGLVNYRLDISYNNESESDENVAEMTQIAR
jgi:hypothetical protein